MELKHLIVAGAGLAGLTAARELSRARVRVTVIDARDRIGGRVWTARAFEEGQHGELGGEFIDEGQEEIHTLAREVGLTLVRVLRAGFTHRFRGADGLYHVSRTRPWTELERTLEPLIAAYRDADGDSAHPAVRDMARLSLRAYLRQRRAGAELHAMATGLRGFFLADPEELSVLPVVEQLAESGSPAQTTVYRIDGGADRLPTALARQSGAQLLLRHRLVAIESIAERVTAIVEDAGALRTRVEADAMVVALPASTLRDVAMTPGLPDDQWGAVTSLRYGRATKVLVQSDIDPFEGRRARAFATDTPLGAFWDGAEEQPARLHLLTFLAGGSASPVLRARAAAGAESVLSDLCWLGMPGADVSGVASATWEDDPWARGGYAFLDPAFDPPLRKVLGRRSGRIVFAGEHTSERWQGYMNGAVETGLRAARELIST